MKDRNAPVCLGKKERNQEMKKEFKREGERGRRASAPEDIENCLLFFIGL